MVLVIIYHVREDLLVRVGKVIRNSLVNDNNFACLSFSRLDASRFLDVCFTHFVLSLFFLICFSLGIDISNMTCTSERWSIAKWLCRRTRDRIKNQLRWVRAQLNNLQMKHAKMFLSLRWTRGLKLGGEMHHLHHIEWWDLIRPTGHFEWGRRDRFGRDVISASIDIVVWKICHCVDVLVPCWVSR